MTLPPSLDNLLLTEIARARYEGVFATLEAVRFGKSFPYPFDEKVPGTVYRFDDMSTPQDFKGQAFLPNMVYLDAQQKLIEPSRSGPMSEEHFIDAITRALTQDNMTIITSSDVISGRRIPNERFEQIALRILENRGDANRKIERLPEQYQEGPTMDDVTKSYMTPIGSPPGGHGTKATLASALAVGAWKMTSFVNTYKRDLMMGNGEDPRFSTFYAMMRESQEPVVSDAGSILASPGIVVAHVSTYMPDAVSGLTRILGFRGTKAEPNRFGEFETLSFQRATQQVLRTIGVREVDEEQVWAYHVPRTGGRRVPIIAVHRHYARTKVGKRSRADRHMIVKPSDFGFDPRTVREHARDKLRLSYAAPVP